MKVSNPDTTVRGDTEVNVDTIEIIENSMLSLGGTGAGDATNLGTNHLNVNAGGILNLGDGSDYQTAAEAHDLVDAEQATIVGRLIGNGTIDAPTYIGNSIAGSPATVAPGNSAGIIAFNGATTTFGDGSALDIEMIDRMAAAGVGYDVITVASDLILQGNSVFNLNELVSDPAYQAGNFALGLITLVVDVQLGHITGMFANTPSDASDGGALNLSTGRLVGLGSTDLDQLTRPPGYQNVLDGLRVKRTGDTTNSMVVPS
ncbi:MAG: hypothetical protein AB8B71_18215 [Paracoccaceae bacterium]